MKRSASELGLRYHSMLHVVHFESDRKDFLLLDSKCIDILSLNLRKSI